MQNKTLAIEKAIAHVKSFFPKLTTVIFTNVGWQYLDENFGTFNFNNVPIDQSILEEAYDSIEILPAIFEVDDKSDVEVDVETVMAEIDYHLQLIYSRIGIDRPSNHDNIFDFVLNDIRETADLKKWTSEDVNIAFRRFLEKD